MTKPQLLHSYALTSDDASSAFWTMAGENYLPRLSDDAKSSVETALGMTWDTVGKISIGEEVITRQVNPVQCKRRYAYRFSHRIFRRLIIKLAMDIIMSFSGLWNSEMVHRSSRQ